MSAPAGRSLSLLRARLRAIAQLERRLDGAQPAVGDDAGGGGADDVDRASNLESRESVAGVAAVLSEERRQVDDAMRRLLAGGYGTCEDCGREIAPERLKLWPEATRCVDCQRGQEMHARASG